MTASKKILEKVIEYQELKQKAEALREEIKGLLENEYADQTGFTLGAEVFEPFVADAPCGEKDEETGTWIQQANEPYKNKRYWYHGKEFIPVKDSKKVIGYEYKA